MSLEIDKKSRHNLFLSAVTGKENWQFVSYKSVDKAKFVLYAHQSNLIEISEFALIYNCEQKFTSCACRNTAQKPLDLLVLEGCSAWMSPILLAGRYVIFML